MLHKEDFCEHFCEMSDKEIVDDIRKSIASFMKQREEGDDFGAKMVHKAKLRIDAVHDVRSDAGKQGGRPRKESTADGDTSEGADVSTTFSDNFEARQSQRRAGADSVRGTPLHSAPARQRASFRNKEEFIQWAIDTGLDPNDAGNCWEATMERGGLTKDGKKVDNICAYTVKWCRTSKKNRETA